MDVLPREHLLPEILKRRAAEEGDRIAFQHVEGPTQTWAELQGSVERWAASYAAAGVTAGDHVVTMIPNSFMAYHAWLGVASLGAVEVPVNNMYVTDMLEYLIQNSEASVVVMAQQFVERLVPFADELANVRLVIVPDADGDLPDLPVETVGPDGFFVDTPAELHDVQIWDICAMVYTSGTTGPSKGVMVPWAELFEFVGLMPDDTLTPDGAYYSMFPAFHVSGKSALYVSAHFGAPLVIRPQFSPGDFLTDVREHNVTLAGLVGPMAQWILMIPEGENDADSPLEKVYMGPIIPDIDTFKERFGVVVATGYGMTEIGAPLASPGWELPNKQTCGRPRTDAYPGYDLRVVDENDIPVGPNEVGELIVRSRAPWTLNAGYWKMPEKTAEAWRNGWFHTGDGFKYDEDGNFYFVDRMKDALRKSGENISSFEVEALVGKHPQVAQCAVIGVPDDHDLEDEVKVFLVANPEGDPLTAEDFTAWVVEHMPKHMVPRYVEFIDSLPQTEGTFRTRKVALRERPVSGEGVFDRKA